MGRRSKRPSEEGGGLENILAEEIVSECPYRSPGALRFLVRRADGQDKPVAGVRIWTGGAGGVQTCITDARGRADFVNKTQGAYQWEAQYAASGIPMLVQEDESGATSVIGRKRRIIPLYVQQVGELVVEVRKDRNGRAGDLLPDDQVVSVAAKGRRQEGVARTAPEQAPPGPVAVQVTLASPVWAVAAQDMRATIRGGERTTFVVRAVERTWLRAQVWDMEGGRAGAGGWLAGAEVRTTLHGEAQTLTTRGADDAATWTPKPLTRYPIDAVRTPDRADEDDLYMFEELV